MNMDGMTRLKTRMRWQEISQSGRPADVKVALLTTFTAEPLLPYMGVTLEDAGFRADLWAGPYNQIMQQCLDDSSQTARYQPDLLVVYPRFEDCWTGRPLPLDDAPEAYSVDLLELADTAFAAARRWGAQVVFVLPAIPEQRPLGLGDDGNDQGVFATATAIRELLRRCCAAQPDVTVIDAESIVRSVGSARAYNHPMFTVARIPFSEEVFGLLGQRIARAILLQRNVARDVLVIAPDNTLWGGRLGEVEPHSIDLTDGGPGDAFCKFQAYLCDLKRSGVRLALSSVHDAAALQSAFARQEMRLNQSDFHAWHANQPPHSSLREIAQECDVALSRIVFLSADATEIEVVQEALPRVATIQMPDDPSLWLPSIQDAGLLDRRWEAPSRAAAPASTPGPRQELTLDDFLAQLNLAVSFARIEAYQTEQVADMTQRTVEFNLTGIVYSGTEVATLLAAPQRETWGVYVKDRFNDYGLAGVFGYEVAADTLVVDLWLLICPVLGKRVEHQVLAQLAQLAQAHRCSNIVFDYQLTSRNYPIYEFLGEIGVGAMREHASGTIVKLPVDVAKRHGAQQIAPVAAVANAPAAGQGQRGRALQQLFRAPDRVQIQAAKRLSTGSQILEAMRMQKEREQPKIERAYVAPRNAVEETLAAVWADVLRVEHVGVYDDFFELGGDSVTAIQLVSKINRTGYQVAPRHLFSHKTIAELATVAEPIATIVEHDRGPIPLVPAQWQLIEQGAAALRSAQWSVLCNIRQPLDRALLAQAIRHAADRHAALRLRFTQATDGSWQSRVDQAALDLCSFHDLTALLPDEQAIAIETTAAQLQAELDCETGSVLRVAYFDRGADNAQALFVVHRLVADESSWRILLDEIQFVYQQLSQGETISLLPRTPTFKHWAERIQVYAQSEGLRQEAAYWLNEQRYPSAPLPRDQVLPAHELASNIVSVALDTAQTRMLLQETLGLYHTNVTTVLLTALARNWSAWTGSPRLLVDLADQTRDALFTDLDLTWTIGPFAAQFPVSVDLRGSFSPIDALKSVKEQLRQIPNHGVGYGVLRYLSQDAAIRNQLRAMPQAEIRLAYREPLEQTALFAPATQASKPQIGAQQHLLAIEASITGDELRIDWTYDGQAYCRSTVERLAQELIAELHILIARSQSADAGSYSAADFPDEDLSEEDLDSILAQLNKL